MTRLFYKFRFILFKFATIQIKGFKTSGLYEFPHKNQRNFCDFML